MDDEELEQGGQGDANITGGRFNPATKVANGAQNVENAAKGVSKLANQSSEKLTQKAAQQAGQQSAKTMAKATSRKKMSETAAKVATKAGKVAKVAAKLAKIMSTVGIIIIILIAIIGILVFIITGFGFIIGGIQQIIDGIGDWWTGWTQGAEQIVKEEEIVKTLSYLEEMQYDLFGYGFITDEKAALKTKEEKDDDGNVTSTKKSLGIDDANDPAYNYIRTYLVSDNYAGIIKNSNKNLKEMFSSWGNFVSGCWGGTGWGSGLISIYNEGSGGIGTKGNASHTSRIGKDLASVENGKLRITKTRISSTAWEYDLDGWIGRYGMPIEFLLATHIATMAPDLSLRLATSFDTDVEILLHKSNNGTVESGIVSKNADLSTISDEQVLTAKEFSDIIDKLKSWYTSMFNWLPTFIVDIAENMLEFYGRLGFSSKDTMQIFRIASEKGVDLVSPESCQGPETENIEIQGEKKTKMKNNSDNYSGNSELDKIKAEIKDEQVEDIIIPSIANSGATLNEVSIEDIKNDLYENIDAIKWYDEGDDQKFNNDGTIAGNKISLSYSAKYDNKDGVLVVELYNGNWSATDENMYSTVTFYYDNGEYAGKKCSEVAKEHASEVEDGDIYACSECTSYVKEVYKALQSVDDMDSDTYVPYINRVTDHWFRNVYFTEAGILDGDNIIETDNEYEKKTGERWTEYEMYKDDSGKEQYELYIYKKKSNGDYKTELENIVCRKVDDGKGNYKLSDDGVTYVKDKKGNYKLFTKNSSGKTTEYNDDSIKEFRVGKKAITKEIKDGWTAYKSGEEEGKWEEMTTDENSPSELKTVAENENIRLVYKATYPTIEQTEDGERGETNATIKKLFLDDYYIYDGTKPTAALIKKAKNMADSDDPDDFKNKFNNWKKKKIIANYPKEGEDKKKYEATIDQISGPISLTHNSLTAFSILENMHTLDAEYIYHDFKELIVELNYFDKEDLTEAEEEVMMFPVAGVSGAGWPVVRYDKSEDFYGTLIHSAEDLEAKRAETEAELYELVDQICAEEPDESVDETTNTQLTDTPEAADNLLLQAAKDIYDYVKQDGGYDYSQPNRASNFEASKTNKFYDCSGFVSWCLQEVGIFPKNKMTYVQQELHILKENELKKYAHAGKPDKLEPGMIIVYSGHVNIYAGDGKYYDGGEHGGIKYKDYNKEIKGYIQIPNDKMTYNGVTGTSSGEASSEEQAEFAGFAGSTEEAPEYVVAPVTGEVVKYGTVNRKNIETGEDNEVGFIKIRVLGSKECKAGSKKGCTRFGGSHTSVSSGDGKKYSNGKLTASDWLEDKYSEKKLEKLGYDYFWSEYNSAGIGDHYVYLEGFDVSDILGGGDHRDGKTGKNIEKLANYIANEDNASKNNYSTQYTVPNLLDDTREFELQVEEEAKKKAAYTITQGDKIYIKEGAVIGKTFSSDNEKITKEQKVEVIDKKAEEKKKEEQEQGVNNIQNSDSSTDDEVATKKKKYHIGNYLRINFRDTDDEMVENVEDFVETSEGGNGSPIETDVPEKLIFFLGVLEEGMWGGTDDLGDGYCARNIGDSAGNTTAFGLTKAVKDTGDIPTMYPNFEQHLNSGKVPKKEAQDIFVIILESARQDLLENRIKDTSNLTEEMLDAMIDLHHASPNKQLPKVTDEYNSTGNVKQSTWEDAWGSATGKFEQRIEGKSS